MSCPRLFGLETEYAVTALDRAGAVVPGHEFCARLLQAAERTLPHLKGAIDPGLFLANGSRLYLDAGDHPELAGPECLHPWDAVRYARAGDAILQGLGEEARRLDPTIADTRVFAGNVDYSGSGATWGAHESYCHRASPEVLRRRLVPHLVSRVIYCGAGGFNPESPGLEFTLSPRAHHIRHVVSGCTTRERGIVDLRDEPLATLPYRRQHVICGETLRSDRASWLKVGTTALVVALVEGGIPCGDDVELDAPVTALRVFAGDVGCRQTVPAKRGGLTSALAIQRHYLDLARRYAGAAFMPPWAEIVCREWSDMLVRLEEGPEGVRRTLDWAIKLTAYQDRAERHGFEWSSLPAWSAIMRRVDAEGLAGASSTTWRPPAGAEGLDRPRLAAFRALRDELFAADMCWGRLGPEGIFAGLDRAGVLDHHVAGVDRVDKALDEPPLEGRAHVRGAVVRRVWKRGHRFSIQWDRIHDHMTGRSLNLADPFESSERWIVPPVRRSQASRADRAEGDPCQPSLLDDLTVLFGRLRRLGRMARERR
jgi:proteasome accessory factor A